MNDFGCRFNDDLFGCFFFAFVLLLGFFVGLLFFRCHAGSDLFLSQRGQQVFQSLTVVGQHVPQSGQRQHGFTTEIEEDLRAGLFVRAFQAVVQQTFVDQADELGAEIGVIDGAFHERFLPSPHHRQRATQKFPQHIVDRGIANLNRMFQYVQGTGHRIGAMGITGTEQNAATSTHGKCTVGRTAVDQSAQGHQPGPGCLPIEQDMRAAFVSGGLVQ